MQPFWTRTHPSISSKMEVFNSYKVNANDYQYDYSEDITICVSERRVLLFLETTEL